MEIFGDLDVRVGPWDVDYGPEAPLEGQDEPATEEVAVDIEMEAADWRPIEPAPSPPPAQLVFVDGVRRLEARLVVRRGERIFHGAFGSYGVGAVAVSAGVARHAEAVVGRLAVVGAGESLPNPVSPMPGLIYQPLSTAPRKWVTSPLGGEKLDGDGGCDGLEAWPKSRRRFTSS